MATSKKVIPVKAGIQKTTGFRVKPGMTYNTIFTSLCIKRISYLSLVLTLSLAMVGCITPKEELHLHGNLSPVTTYPKDYIHPLTEINLEKVINENRGLRVLEENARTVHDYYRAGVQEKEEGEKLLREGKWEGAQIHLEDSNRLLRIVLRYLDKDEAYRNIYGDHVIIFLPNLLSADNYLKLAGLYGKMEKEDKGMESIGHGRYYLSQSLKHVKTEWAFQIKKGFEELDKK